MSEPRDIRLLFGPLAAVILLLGVVGLALWVPGYSHVRQTVSEIGEIGSPARVPFAITLCGVAICILIFALGIRERCIAAGYSQWTAWLTGFMALSAAGVGVFAFPHPLHNVFGLSELVGYQAPLAMALSWRRGREARAAVTLSWIFFVLIWIAIAFNLSPAVESIWVHLKPYHGLVQRALFAAWFGWCGVIGVLLFKQPLSVES